MSLIAWYKLDGNALDSSGNGYNLTTNTATPTTAGKIGGCYTFASGNAISATSGINLPHNVSFTAWAYNNNAFAGSMMIFSCNSTLYSGPDLYFTGTIAWNTGDGAGNPFKKDGVNVVYPSSNAWHHYAVVNNQELNKAFLYIDGEYYGEAVYRNTFQENRGFTIGNYKPGSTGYAWRGMIDDVRIYSHALSEKEVKELSKGKVLHYKFDDFQEPTENLAPDISQFAYENHAGRTSFSLYDGVARFECVAETPIDTAFTLKGNIQSITPSESYSFSFLARAVGLNNFDIREGGSYRWNILWKDASGTTIGYSLPSNQLLLSDWQLFSLVGESPLGATSAVINIGADIPNFVSVGSYVEIKNIQLEAKNHATPFTPTIRTGLVKDISGYENNAELTESTTPRWMEEGIIGKGSYLFNGTTSGIERIGDFSDIKTISMWVNSQSIPTDSRVLLVHRPTGVGLGFYNNGYLILASEGNSQRTAIISGFKNNSWNHIAITYSDTKVPTCYINGIETTYSTTNNWTVPETTLYIGRRTSGSAFDGQIDDVRIYATALSADDVKELYQTKANLDKNGNMSVMNLNQIDTTNLEIKTNGILNSADISEVGVSNGLVAWYPLDGNTRDYTENRNDGTNNGATIASGLDQLCYSFDGVDDYINIDGSASTISGSSFTLSAWIKGPSQDHKGVIAFNSSGGGNRALWLIRTTGMGIYDSSTWYIGGVSVGTNEWQHVALTYTTGTKEAILYADGAIDSTFTTNTDIIINSTDRVSIGQEWDSASPSDFFTGLIQDVRIYNRALAPEEIKILYELRKNKKTHFTHDNKVFIPGKFNEVY